jgi:thioredoxin reductase
MMLNLSEEEYLDQFKISENKYLIGIYQDGITVFKQQVRALNIFHALINTKKLIVGQDTKIGIIGGGIAGLTFSAAALKAGFQVKIIEDESHFLHIQHGCETRKIHPNIYEWPEIGAKFPYAKLPVLSWKYDTAANVTKKILTEFERIIGNLKKSRFLKSCSADIKEIKERNGQFEIDHEGDDGVNTYHCKLIIFAVGYGLEKSSIDGIKNTPSYWRNDSFGQSFLDNKKSEILDNKKSEIVISGVGDGGLIDAFRILIKDFNYDLVFRILEANEHYEELVDDLLRIRQEGVNSRILSDDFLWNKFSDIHPHLYETLHKTLDNQNLYRRDNVTLHGTNDKFETSLKFNRISLLNSFLAFIFYKHKKLRYRKGVISFESITNTYSIDGEQLSQGVRFIVRHGTDREGLIKTLPLSDTERGQLRLLKEKQLQNFNNGLVPQRWTFSDFIKYFEPDNTKSIEYLTPDTASICSGFISVLNQVLQNYHKSKKHFRIALHRVLSFQGDLHFQQITSYFGTRKVKNHGAIGQVHNGNRGNVGYSIFSGKPLLITRENEVSFRELIDSLNLEHDYSKIKESNSFFTLPILGEIPKNLKGENYEGEKLATNLVLFIDSHDPSFFGTLDSEKVFNTEVLDIIVSAAKGFVETINTLLREQQISIGPIDFIPTPINTDYRSFLFDHECVFNTSELPKELLKKMSDLRLPSVYSFDIVYNS